MIETGLKKIRSLFIFDLISYHEDNNLEKLSESLLQCGSTNVLSVFLWDSLYSCSTLLRWHQKGSFLFNCVILSEG